MTPAHGQAGKDFTEVQLSVNHAGLGPGDYHCTLEIQSKDVVNSPSVIEVSLTVTGPEFGICPPRIEVTILEGETPSNRILSLRNHGSGLINWQIINDNPWLQINSSTGELSGEQVTRVGIDLKISGFSPGCYETSLLITDDIDQGHKREVSVVLNVVDSILHVPQEYPTIQMAIDASINGSVVVVADGTYTGQGNRNLSFQGKAITVKSENGSNRCILDCEQRDLAFCFESNETVSSILEGFTIINGVSGLGGGIYINDANPSIRDCIITYCRADQGAGGGIYCANGEPIIRDCQITHNTADDGQSGGSGGGIYLGMATSARIEHCIIANNFAAYHDHSVSVQSYMGLGGGIFCGRGVDIGAHLDRDVVKDCVLVGNTAGHSGGGIAVGKTGTVIKHSTLANNTADIESGDLYLYADPLWANRTELSNCIIWDSSPSHIAEGMFMTYSCIEGGFPGTGNLDQDPLFVNPANPIGDDNVWWTGDDGFTLQANSPCRNAASDGTPMGAYQF